MVRTMVRTIVTASQVLGLGLEVGQAKWMHW